MNFLNRYVCVIVLGTLLSTLCMASSSDMCLLTNALDRILLSSKPQTPCGTLTIPYNLTVVKASYGDPRTAITAKSAYNKKNFKPAGNINQKGEFQILEYKKDIQRAVLLTNSRTHIPHTRLALITGNESNFIVPSDVTTHFNWRAIAPQNPAIPISWILNERPLFWGCSISSVVTMGNPIALSFDGLLTEFTRTDDHNPEKTLVGLFKADGLQKVSERFEQFNTFTQSGIGQAKIICKVLPTREIATCWIAVDIYPGAHKHLQEHEGETSQHSYAVMFFILLSTAHAETTLANPIRNAETVPELVTVLASNAHKFSNPADRKALEYSSQILCIMGSGPF